MVSGTQTIFQSWQESGSLAAGLGTWITSTNFTGSNGFDATNANLASIATHNQAGANWVYTMANTNVTLLSANQGYMLFVRGDRNYTPTLPTPTATSATTLRTTGTLNQGTQAGITVASTGIGRTLIGNPFASAVDMENIFSATANLDQNMYVWDPTLTGNSGAGGFRLVERTAPNTYQQTPVVAGGTSASATSRYIHSGQAFFLKATGANASVVFNETDKSALISPVNPIVNTAGDQQLWANLMIVNPGNEASLADGIRVRYDVAYNASASDDVIKMGNFAENMASFRDGIKLIVEKRPMITEHDTIFLRITNTRIKDYRIQIGTFDFVQNDFPAVLEDNYLHTKTNVNLKGGITNYDFSVTADPASSAADRFRIVFGISKTDVPVVNTGVKGISIYPNPVNKTMITILFTDMEKGVYRLQLINSLGQVVIAQQVNHNGGNSKQTMELNKQTTNGNYRLEIVKPDNSRMVKGLVILN